MPQAVLTLTDLPDGSFSVQIQFGGQQRVGDIQHLSEAQAKALSLFHELCPDASPSDTRH